MIDGSIVVLWLSSSHRSMQENNNFVVGFFVVLKRQTTNGLQTIKDPISKQLRTDRLIAQSLLLSLVDDLLRISAYYHSF
jgi:hypothetical protein